LLADVGAGNLWEEISATTGVSVGALWVHMRRVR
jgi:hypothetical protein